MKAAAVMAARGALLALLAALGGCSVRPAETADAFARALQRRDVNALAAMCLPSMQAGLTNSASALCAFTRHVTNVTCVVSGMRSGGDSVSVLLDVDMTMQFPPPGVLRGQLVLDLDRRGPRWYVATGHVRIAQYVEFRTERQEGVDCLVWDLAVPRYGYVMPIDEPLQDFVRRVDRYFRSFEP